MAEPIQHTIRTATGSDMPVLLRLWQLLEHEQATARVMPTVPDAAQRIEALFGEAIEDPDARVLLAEAAGEALGMAVVRFEAQKQRSLTDGASVELSRVVVVPGARGRGIGRALIEHAEAFARERGAAWLGAKVFARNEGGRAFWAREGFFVHYEGHVRPVE